MKFIKILLGVIILLIIVLVFYGSELSITKNTKLAFVEAREAIIWFVSIGFGIFVIMKLMSIVDDK